MTPTNKYKRAESLFNDRTKRELADMVVHREADLEDARAENAKLQNDADLLRSMLQAKRKDTHALMSENAELREQLAKARDPQHIGGQADPSSFVYAIEQLREFRWQHATNDEEAIPYINNVADAHERENAKLRDERDGWKKVCVNQEVMHVMHEDALDNENEKLRELLQRLLVEYRYLRVRPRKTYLQHEGRMRAIEKEMRDLGVEVDE